jgi:ribA/ribD-fused uncharacterized protein
MPGKIYLINQDEEVRFLNNFSRHPVTMGGETYETSEHYFQAAKFFRTDPEWAKKVAEAKGPAACKKLGNSREHKIQENWNKIWALIYMEKVLIRKARQHECVMNQLMATGHDYIVERADWDDIWGDGPYGYGRNQLGRLWMKVRRYFETGKMEEFVKVCPLCFGKSVDDNVIDCPTCKNSGIVEVAKF